MKTENNLEHKVECIRCNIEKPLLDYYIVKGKCLKHCKSCHKKATTESYIKNPIRKEKKNAKSLERYHNIVSKNNPQYEENSEWKDIEGYGGVYQINKNGEIRRWKKERNRWKNLKPYIVVNGYLKVTLTINYKEDKQLLHRLVAKAFLPLIEDKNEVNHIDGNKLNNKVENLEWCNRSENMKHAHKIGLIDGITKRNKNGKIAKGNRS